MPLAESGFEIPRRAELALTKKTLVAEWNIKPWEIEKLSTRDFQDVLLAKHAESYIQKEQQDRTHGGSSLSKEKYDVASSRRDAFQ